MKPSNFILKRLVTILLTVAISGYCTGKDCQTIEQVENSSAAVVGGLVIAGEPEGNPVINAAVLDFNYREFIRNKHLSGPARRTLRNVNENQPHRDEEVFIDFDDHEVGPSWGTVEVLHDFYEDLGVNFRGNNDIDGGGVMNENGGFGVNGHSSPNFIAFNTIGRYPNGGLARPPQFIIFDAPVDIVTILAGARDNEAVTMTAFTASNSPPTTCLRAYISSGWKLPVGYYRRKQC